MTRVKDGTHKQVKDCTGNCRTVRMRVRRPEYLARRALDGDVVRQEWYYCRSGSSKDARSGRRRRRQRWAAGWMFSATRPDLVFTWLLLRGCHTLGEGDGASERTNERLERRRHLIDRRPVSFLRLFTDETSKRLASSSWTFFSKCRPPSP